jgi:uncharacterized protein (TIGR03435 family)
MASIEIQCIAGRRVSFLAVFTLGLLFAASLSTHAQTTTAQGASTTSAEKAPDKLPAFEVATIKPVDMSPGVEHMMGTNVYPGGRIRITSFPLKSLICVAFNIGYWQLSGGDDWTNKAMYDVEAKPAETTPPTTYNLRHGNFGIEDERLRQMLQALLIERFQLKFHRETTTGPVYLLEKSGKPIPLQPSKEAGAKMYGEGYSGDVGFVGVGGGRWSIYNTSMPQLAKFAGDNILHQPVLDRTGLDGAFDFRWTMIAASSDAQSVDSTNIVALFHDTFPLFLQTMGLKLTKSTGPVETFVIDHAEPPSPN